MKINLESPCSGLFRYNAFTRGKSRALQAFVRLGKLAEFKRWLLSLKKHAGIENMDEHFVNQLLKQESKPSNFVRFLSTLNPETFIYSIDYNWKNRAGNFATNGSVKQYGYVNINKFLADPVKHLKAGRVVSEKTQLNRISRIAFDLDGSQANLEHSIMPGGRIPESEGELLEYFKHVLHLYFIEQLGLGSIEVCCDARNDMSKKYSWHISLDSWVASWNDDIPNIIAALLLIDSELNSWLQTGVLDTSPYDSWNLWGMCYCSKWSDLKKCSDGLTSVPRHFVPDQNFPDIERHLIHWYHPEQPKCIDIPRVEVEQEKQSSGKSRFINKIRVSKKLKAGLKNYNPGPMKFRKSRKPAGFSALELFKCIYPSNHHDIFEVSVTRAFVYLCIDEKIERGVAYKTYFEHTQNFKENSLDGKRRGNPSRVKTNFDFWWKKCVFDYNLKAANNQLGQILTSAYNVLLCYVNKTVVQTDFDQLLLNEAYHFPKSETCHARYISEIIKPGRYPERCVICRSGMNTGKSTMVADFMPDKRVLYIISSRKLADNVVGKLLDKKIDASNYQDFDKCKYLLGNIDVLVISMQSLYHIGQAEKYDLVIFDEMCSILRDVFDYNTNRAIEKNLHVLKHVLTNCAKSVVLDAQLTNVECQFLELFFPKNDIKKIHNLFRFKEKKAILYSTPDCKKVQEPGPHCAWFNSLKTHLKKRGRHGLTQVFCAPPKEMDYLLENVCEHPDNSRIKKYIGLLPEHCDVIMEYSGHLKKKRLRTLVVTGKYKANLSTLEEQLHGKNVFMHNTAVTVGVDINIPKKKSRLTDVFIMASWFIGCCQIYLQGAERIRNCKEGFHKTLHICTKRKGRPPKEASYPLGYNKLRIHFEKKIPVIVRQWVRRIDSKLFNVWVRLENQKGIYAQLTDLSWEYWLRDTGYSVTKAKENTSAFNFETPRKKIARSLDSIENVNETYMSKHSLVEIDHGFGKTTDYDKKAKIQKNIFKAVRKEKQFANLTEFVPFLKNTFGVELPKSWKKQTFEQFKTTHVFSQDFKDILCLEDELHQRKNEKTEFNRDGTIKEVTYKTDHMRGLELLWKQFKANFESKAFERWREKWSCIDLLRLRKSGLTCSEDNTNALMKMRFEKKNIFGLLFDANSRKIVLLSKIERESIGQAFCSKPQLTELEYKQVTTTCLKYIEEILSAFGPLPKKQKPEAIPKLLLKKLLTMYNLRAVKCRGLASPCTLPFQLRLDIPGCKATIAQKRRFMSYIHQDYAELYDQVIAETRNDIHKFASTFQKAFLSGANHSLISCFCGRNRPKFRLYWSLFVPKVYRTITEIAFQPRLKFKKLKEKTTFMFLED